MACLSGCAPQSRPQRGIVWRVSGPGGTQHTIVPTFHRAIADLSRLPNGILSAVLAAELVAVESIVESSFNPEQCGNTHARKAFARPLAPEDLTSIERVLGHRLLGQERSLPPYALYSAVSQRALSALNARTEHGTDVALTRAARDFGKPLVSIEDACELQRLAMGASVGISAASVLQLAQAISEGRLATTLKQAEDAWISGDPVMLERSAAQLRELTVTEAALVSRLVDSRNSSIAMFLLTSLQGKSTVVGVGFMHCFGNDSLLSEVKKLGATVTLVVGS